MKILAIVKKNLIEYWREPQLFLLMIIFPSMLLVFYYFAFGQSANGISQILRVLIMNRDVGWAGKEIIQIVSGMSYKGKPVFNVSTVDNKTGAITELREGKAALMIDIPTGLTEALAKSKNNIDQPAEITFIGDPTSDAYAFAHSFLIDLDNKFNGMDAQEVKYSFIPGTGTMSDFQFGVAGTIIFGILFLIISSALVLVRESSRNTLRRLKMSQVSSFDVLLGTCLAQLIVAGLQIIITFTSAEALGFHASGSPGLVAVICFLLSLASIGLGLFSACFARNDGEAVNLATGIMVPLVFLSGAIFPMPSIPMFKIGNTTIQVYDLLPSTHAAEALRRIIILGEDLNHIFYPCTCLILLSFIYLGAGVYFYHKLHLS